MENHFMIGPKTGAASWGQHQPLKFFFVSIPRISISEKRWAWFQAILSIVFFFFAIAFGILTIDESQVGRTAMISAFIFFSLGMLCLVYAIGIGIHCIPLIVIKIVRKMKQKEQREMTDYTKIYIY